MFKKIILHITTYPWYIFFFNLYFKNNFNCSENEDDWKPTLALGPIQKVREEIVNINQQWSKVKNRVYVFVQTGISHTECKYLYFIRINTINFE